MNFIELEVCTSGSMCSRTNKNPFLDLDVWAVVVDPDGRELCIPGFYDGKRANGKDAWIIRVRADKAGEWTWKTFSDPEDIEMRKEGKYTVDQPCKVRSVYYDPAYTYGLADSSGAPCLMIGDTMYNLFGAAHCGVDIRPMLVRRRRQGINMVRVRLHVSEWHPGFLSNEWQGRSVWPWEGNIQLPDCSRLNLDWFRSVDKVMKMLEELEMGCEMILLAWLYEYPFNDYSILTPEYAEMFVRYAVARYSVYGSLWFWSPTNEYNLYSSNNGKSMESPESRRYFLRTARLINSMDPYKHPVSVHDTASNACEVSLKDRFRKNPEVGALFAQHWGSLENAASKAMAEGIDSYLKKHVVDHGKINVLAEYGYEIYMGDDPEYGRWPKRYPALHDDLGSGHTRRGAWRALFAGCHVITGFENTFLAHFTERYEPVGAEQIVHMRRFFEEVFHFDGLRPDESLLEQDHETSRPTSHRGIVLSEYENGERKRAAVYLPAGGRIKLAAGSAARPSSALWFDPETGGARVEKAEDWIFEAPDGFDSRGDGKDWVLVLYW